MSLHLYRVGEYSHASEIRSFKHIVKVLRERFGDSRDHAFLIGNYNIGGVELDAILFTERKVYVLEFKNWGGKIVAAENGPWTADGKPIHGGNQQNSPFFQIRRNRGAAAKELAQQLRLTHPLLLGAAILFSQRATFDLQGLSDNVRKWLDVRELSDFGKFIEQADECSFSCTTAQLEEWEQRLNLSQFALDDELHPLVAQGNYVSHAAQADDFYTPLSAMAQKEDLTVRERCKVLYDTFCKATNERLRESSILFTNLFPKVAHLLKEHDAPDALSRTVHDARAQLWKQEEYSDEQLTAVYPFHLKAVCRYISLIYDDAPIPEPLQALFPADGYARKHTRTHKLGKYLRVTAESIDDQFIYATRQDTGEAVKIDYSAENRFWTGDRDYLKTIVTKDCQLNVLAPRVEDDPTVLYPELIVYEPDYLLNVTQISACFKPYGNKPYNHLLNRLTAFSGSEHTVLGNFAGELLDEQIRREERDVNESLQEFFAEHTMGMTTTPNVRLQELAIQGRLQAKNIRRALVDIEEQQEIDKLDTAQLIIEPTFFSDVLGISGRMDLLELNKRLIVEQKAGKGDYGSDDAFVHAKEDHRVQISLYRALMHYQFDTSNQDLRTLLLYSKYMRPLVDVGHSPALLAKAIQVRNCVVFCEFLYAQGGLPFLDTLTPEHLISKEVNENFWQKYALPQINQVLTPIHKAEPLEKAYFYRFLQFVQRELMHSKLGNARKDDSGFAALWQATLTDKIKSGNIYYQLALQLPEEQGNISSVRFEIDNGDSPSNFRKGDTVILYPYSGVPNACEEMVFRAIVKEISANEMEIEFLNRQTSRTIFRHYEEKGCEWALEHDLLESSFSGLYQGLHSLLTTTKSRRDLLLFQRLPKTNEALTLKGTYGTFDELVLRAKQAEDFFLILGPPGTGKTSHGMLTLVQEELQEAGHTILLTAYTHRAVDEICEKLMEAGIDFIRLGNHNATEVPEEYLFEHRTANCRTVLEEVEAILQKTRIFCATTAAINNNTAFLRKKRFDLAIIDEASQLLEPHLVGMLTALNGGEEAIRRFVLIGDHKQLPAVVQQSAQDCLVTEPLLREIGVTNCGQSFFERLYHRYGQDARHCYMLTHQGRMHEEIAQYPNEAFYEGKLRCVPLSHQLSPLREDISATGIRALLSRHRLAFIHPLGVPPSEYDKVNREEAVMIAATVRAVYEQWAADGKEFLPASTVGVIVPYRNQIIAVRKALAEYGITAFDDITIDTVERYQGSQRDVIIYGFTIHNPYQLNFLTANTFEENGKLIDRKLNVAMTRAREHLFLIGNAELLEKDCLFASLLAYLRKENAYYEFPYRKYVENRF